MSDTTKQLREALHNLLGQVEQARDGFGIWPYKGSDSMAEAVEAARVVLGGEKDECGYGGPCSKFPHCSCPIV